jgi:DNA replication protein DnaC
MSGRIIAIASGKGGVGKTWLAISLSQALAREGERVLGKEVKRRAFRLAKARYEEVWPQLAELYEMEQAQREFEKRVDKWLTDLQEAVEDARCWDKIEPPAQS